MNILRRKSGKPKLISGPITMNLQPKDLRGSTSSHRRIIVSAQTKDVPSVSVWIQDQNMAVGVYLDEEEMGRLVKGLHDALEASKAIAASRESPESSQDG